MLVPLIDLVEYLVQRGKNLPQLIESPDGRSHLPLRQAFERCRGVPAVASQPLVVEVIHQLEDVLRRKLEIAVPSRNGSINLGTRPVHHGVSHSVPPSAAHMPGKPGSPPPNWRGNCRAQHLAASLTAAPLDRVLLQAPAQPQEDEHRDKQ